MTGPLMTARHYGDHAHGKPVGQVALGYEDRFLRRKVLTLTDGGSLLVDLPRTTSLDHGGVLVTTDGQEVAVVAAPEPLLEITAPDLTRIAWHVGNRHTPCQIEDARLLIQPDHVIRELLERLGASVCDVVEPFTPEGGAYGHGRTHGHDHSHLHEPVNRHPHDHDH